MRTKAARTGSFPFWGRQLGVRSHLGWCTIRPILETAFSIHSLWRMVRFKRRIEGNVSAWTNGRTDGWMDGATKTCPKHEPSFELDCIFQWTIPDITTFDHDRPRVLPHSVNVRQRRTPCAVAVADVLITSKRRPALAAVTPLPKFALVSLVLVDGYMQKKKA